MRPVSDFDPFAPETLACPYEFYAALRREAPVHPVPGAGYFLVTRPEDIRAVVRDPGTFSSSLVPVLLGNLPPDVREVRTRGLTPVDVLATADPPSHTRQRQLVNRAFNVRRIAALEPRIRALADELIARFVDARRVEWMDAFAVPLPMTVIADLLGFPRADLPRLAAWSHQGVGVLSGTSSRAAQLEQARALVALQQYLLARFAAERTSPGDGVMGDLVRASAEGPERLTTEEVVAILVQLLIAGNESTTGLVGSAAWLLARHPDVRRALVDDPALVPSFVEEALRLESPFQGLFRVVRADTELGGVRLAAGTRLMLVWAAANRDEHAYDRAGEIDLRRPSPKEHLAFGEGIHYCLGASLARLEARIAVERLLARLTGVRLARGWSPTWVQSVFVRRLAVLELEFD